MFPPEYFFFLDRFLHRYLWEGVGPVWNALHLLSRYLEGISFEIEIEVPRFVHLIHPEKISIGKGTLIEPGVCIKGPCIIGKECIIRHGAFLRDGVVCGNGCLIGHSTEIKHSILLDYVCATHFSYVGDSILGNGVNLGAGVKCANLRLDRREVVIPFQGEKVNTGLRKMGAVIGDRSQVGCNSVFNPGTLVGKECLFHPLVNAGGFIPSQSLVGRESVGLA